MNTDSTVISVYSLVILKCPLDTFHWLREKNAYSYLCLDRKVLYKLTTGVITVTWLTDAG